ncbi:hypothetical protein HDV00_005355 [Rhizophlyctis rosea]|nr:hypothetical protein HDV00_005355 [Rhizophlyctis rosea]
MNDDCKSGYCDQNNTVNGFFQTCQTPNAPRVSPAAGPVTRTSTTASSLTTSTSSSSTPSPLTPSPLPTSTTLQVAGTSTITVTQSSQSSSTPVSNTDNTSGTQPNTIAATSSTPFTSTSGFKALIAIIVILILAILLFLWYRKRQQSRNGKSLVQNVSTPSPANPLYEQYIAMPPSPETLPRDVKVKKEPEMVPIRDNSISGDLSLGARALMENEPLEGVAPVGGAPRAHGDARVVDSSRDDVELGNAENKVVATARFYPREENELFLTPNADIHWMATYADGWGYGMNLATEQSGYFPMALVKGEAAARAAQAGNLHTWG